MTCEARVGGTGQPPPPRKRISLRRMTAVTRMMHSFFTVLTVNYDHVIWMIQEKQIVMNEVKQQISLEILEEWHA